MKHNFISCPGPGKSSSYFDYHIRELIAVCRDCGAKWEPSYNADYTLRTGWRRVWAESRHHMKTEVESPRPRQGWYGRARDKVRGWLHW